MWDARDLTARLMLNGAEAHLLVDLLGNKLKNMQGDIELARLDKPQKLAARNLVRAGLAHFTFLNGALEAPTGLSFTQLGYVSARFFEVLEAAG
jgi:hypothetical protein